MKDDGTPVTVADREAEQLLRSRIESQYPDHAILGEEFGESNPGAPVRWILDPIDGTKSFMRGVPLYGVLVGIEIQGEPNVGVIHLPALSETVAAGRGLGCRWNDGTANVSPTARLGDGLVCTTGLRWLADSDDAAGMRRLAVASSYARGWGDCYGHVLVATGRADVMVDPQLSPWDAAPILTVVTEAGGRFTDVEGNATIHGGSGVSTNGHLHEEVLQTLRGDEPR